MKGQKEEHILDGFQKLCIHYVFVGIVPLWLVFVLVIAYAIQKM